MRILMSGEDKVPSDKDAEQKRVKKHVAERRNANEHFNMIRHSNIMKA